MKKGTLPQIEGKTNRNDRQGRERKGAGFLPSLLSKLGLSGLDGTGGSSGAGAFSSAAGSAGQGALLGGLLATKAGLVALILAGTTVAGIGIVADQTGIFGTADQARGGMSSLFDGLTGRRPAATAEPSGAGSGAGGSLSDLSKANKGALGDSSAGAGEGTQVAGAPADGSAAAPDNANAPANVGSARAKLGAMKGFSNSDIAGGGGSSGALAKASANGTLELAGGANGASSGMRPSVKTASASGLRTNFGRRGSALSQAQGVRSDNMRAVRSNTPSSQAAGATYDGAHSAPAIGAAQNISGGGVGDGGAGASANHGVKPNAQAQPNQLPPPPPVGPAKNVTPWQWVTYAFIGAMALATVLLLASGIFNKKAKAAAATPATAASAEGFFTTAETLAGLATAAAAVATIMGVIMMTTYGQTMQGAMYTAIGGILTFYAGMTFFDNEQEREDAIAKRTDLLKNEVANKLGVDVHTITLNPDGSGSALQGDKVVNFTGAKLENGSLASTFSKGSVVDVAKTPLSGGAAQAEGFTEPSDPPDPRQLP